jgi:hypothetical protein
MNRFLKIVAKFFILPLAMVILTGCDRISDNFSVAPREASPGMQISLDWGSEETRNLAQLIFERNPHLTPGQLSDLTWWAEMRDIQDPPTVPVIREIDDPSEIIHVHDRCMVEKGWELRGIGSINVPPDQRQAFNLDFWICAASYPISEDISTFRDRQVSEAEIRYTYNYWVEELIPCMANIGIVIGPPPSIETLISTWGTFDQWAPSADLIERTNLIGSELNAVDVICPEFPGMARIQALYN